MVLRNWVWADVGQFQIHRNLCQMKTSNLLPTLKGQQSSYINIYIAPQNTVGTMWHNFELPATLTLFFLKIHTQFSNKFSTSRVFF